MENIHKFYIIISKILLIFVQILYKLFKNFLNFLSWLYNCWLIYGSSYLKNYINKNLSNILNFEGCKYCPLTFRLSPRHPPLQIQNPGYGPVRKILTSLPAKTTVRVNNMPVYGYNANQGRSQTFGREGARRGQ